jgi:hypothetical protein
MTRAPAAGRASTVTSNFAWLVRLRWGAVASQVLTILAVHVGLGLGLALAPLFACVGLAALSNLACALWLARGAPVSEARIAGVMALDHVLLTALLYLAGGAMNPFSVLYLVHVALSAAILQARYAWALAVLSTALFGVLFLLPARHDAVMHAMGMHGHDSPELFLHFQGMWVAFAIAAFFIVTFVTRIASSLERARAQLKNALDACADEVQLEASVQGEWVTLEIVDRGTGMSEDVLARVGEPFFTTKPTGRGMGLGVFLARAVLERLEGELQFVSEAGRGTSARARFRSPPVQGGQVHTV